MVRNILRRAVLWRGISCEPVAFVSGSLRSVSRLVKIVCLFVCLVHGIPVVCGGRHLTKDGPCGTHRQAEAVLFVRRKPTPEAAPPFAGCRGGLAVSGLSRFADWPPGRSLSLLRSACWVAGWVFLGTINPCAPVHPKWSAYQDYPMYS